MWLAIFNVASGLGQKIVAEDVERLDQVTYLRKLGCHEFQGYLLAEPMPAAAFEAWLVHRRRNAVHELEGRVETGLQMAG